MKGATVLAVVTMGLSIVLARESLVVEWKLDGEGDPIIPEDCTVMRYHPRTAKYYATVKDSDGDGVDADTAEISRHNVDGNLIDYSTINQQTPEGEATVTFSYSTDEEPLSDMVNEDAEAKVKATKEDWNSDDTGYSTYTETVLVYDQNFGGYGESGE
jgi:hypothetical protein